MYCPAVDLEDQFEVSKDLLRRHHKMSVYHRHKDCHLYIFAAWVIDLLEERPGLSSIQNDLIPFLCRYQFSSLSLKWRSRTRQAQAQLALSMSHSSQAETVYGYSSATQGDMDAKDQQAISPVRCFALVAPEHVYAARINNITQLQAANIQIGQASFHALPWGTEVKDGPTLGVADGPFNLRHEAVAAYPDAKIDNTTIMASSIVARNAEISRSIIGAHCVLGENVVIEDSILLDHISVEDNAVLRNCLLAPNSQVGQGSTLERCIVAPAYIVPPGSIETGTQLL
jgi:translation initiation factor eIF-2B subunit gamma